MRGNCMLSPSSRRAIFDAFENDYAARRTTRIPAAGVRVRNTRANAGVEQRLIREGLNIEFVGKEPDPCHGTTIREQPDFLQSLRALYLRCHVCAHRRASARAARPAARSRDGKFRNASAPKFSRQVP